jgi:hypothetical protein
MSMQTNVSTGKCLPRQSDNFFALHLGTIFNLKNDKKIFFLTFWKNLSVFETKFAYVGIALFFSSGKIYPKNGGK